MGSVRNESFTAGTTGTEHFVDQATDAIVALSAYGAPRAFVG